YSLIFSHYSGPHRHLHSFPTRRSSDLPPPCSRIAQAATTRRTSTTAEKVGVRWTIFVFISETSARLWVDSRRHGSGNAAVAPCPDRKSTRLNSSHLVISYAVFCLKKKK